MSLIKFNNRRRLFPTWDNEKLKSFLSADDFFNTGFFEDDGMLPAMNVKEHDKDFEVEFAAPGFTKEDFEITLQDHTLMVSGEKKIEKEEKEEDFTRKEFSYNSFKRSLRLPESVNTDQDIKATYKNGILKLNLLKNEEELAAPKRVIEVQ